MLYCKKQHNDYTTSRFTPTCCEPPRRTPRRPRAGGCGPLTRHNMLFINIIINDNNVDINLNSVNIIITISTLINY